MITVIAMVLGLGYSLSVLPDREIPDLPFYPDIPNTGDIDPIDPSSDVELDRNWYDGRDISDLYIRTKRSYPDNPNDHSWTRNDRNYNGNLAGSDRFDRRGHVREDTKDVFRF